MSLKNAVEFMLYTNFGIDFKAGNIDTILNVAIDKAYKDATMQGAYNALKKENTDSIDIKTIKGNLKKEIKDLLGNDKDYNNWHNSICNYLIETAFKDVVLVKDEQQAFTYGNAQKWINMTMKYLYILSEVFHEYKKGCEFDEYYKKIKKLYSQLQMPVDSYIIKSLWNDRSVELPIATVKDFRDEKYKENRAKPWSKWDKTDYEKFKKSISKKECYPLELEHKLWIDEGKNR